MTFLKTVKITGVFVISPKKTTVVGASTMYWGITQCKNDDNMTVLLVVVTSTVLVVVYWGTTQRMPAHPVVLYYGI